MKGGPEGGVQEVLFVECFRFCVSLVPGSALLNVVVPESDALFVPSLWPQTISVVLLGVFPVFCHPLLQDIHM